MGYMEDNIRKEIEAQKRTRAAQLAKLMETKIYIRPHYMATGTDIAREYFPELSVPEIRKLAEVIASKFQEIDNLVALYSQEAIAASKPENLDKWFADNYRLEMLDLTIQKRNHA